MQSNIEQEAYLAARRRVKARLGFFIHLAVFITVNAMLIGINLSRTPERLWFQWPLLGWGIGIAAHALAVLLPHRLCTLKERMIDRAARKEMERQQVAKS